MFKKEEEEIFEAIVSRFPELGIKKCDKVSDEMHDFIVSFSIAFMNVIKKRHVKN